MGLETATYVSQLVVTNPVVGDPVKEGDDHLRLIKTALQNTFPNSSKALYFPTSVAEQTSTVNVAAADAGKVYPVSADAAARTVNLPAAPPDGFEVTIIKTDASANLVTIEPPGAVEINGQTNITLEFEFESARCIYLSTFGAWLALRGPAFSPLDMDYADNVVWPIANGGTGQDTAYEAFDALSVARVDVASAATVDLDAAQSSYVRITGTTAITAVTLTAGRKRWVLFADALTFTHGASLILPTGGNITTVAGDVALLIGEAAGVVRCVQYFRSAGTPLSLAPASQADMETATSVLTTVSPGRQHFHPGHPKAGGNFDGTGTPAFRTGDYGMGAITDNGAGDYTLALDTAFANTNFWIAGWARREGTDRGAILTGQEGGTKTTSSMQVQTHQYSSGESILDSPEVGISFWGDYA